MKKLQVHHYVMLTLLAVGSCNLDAREQYGVVTQRYHGGEDVVTQRHSEFKEQMNRLQSQIDNVRSEAKNCSQVQLNEKLSSIELKIIALDKNPEFMNVTLHDTHIDTLQRELKNARKYVKKHGMNNGEVRVQTVDLDDDNDDNISAPTSSAQGASTSKGASGYHEYGGVKVQRVDLDTEDEDDDISAPASAAQGASASKGSSGYYQ